MTHHNDLPHRRESLELVRIALRLADAAQALIDIVSELRGVVDARESSSREGEQHAA